MTHYQYKAVNSAGTPIKGEMDAPNEVDLELRLARMGLDLVRARVMARPSFFWSRQRVTRRDLIIFCFQLEQLINAGVPLLDALVDLRDSTHTPYFQRVLGGLVADVEGGKMLSQALTAYPQIFDGVFVNLVAAGEKTGELPKVFSHLSQSIKWQDELMTQTRQLMLYPLVLLAMVTVALVVLLVYLVPELVSFLYSLGKELPWTTKSLIWISDFIVNDGWWFLMAIVAAGVAVHFAIQRNAQAAYQWDYFILKFPLLGEIREKMIMARFSRYFGLMYQSGIPVLDALRTCEHIVDNRVVAEALNRVYLQINAGDNLAQSFSNSGFFPPLVVRMVGVGETTGTLDKSLMNVSYFFDRDVSDRMQQMLRMLEPTLTILLGLMLLMIMASVLLPIYDSFGAMKL